MAGSATQRVEDFPAPDTGQAYDRALVAQRQRRHRERLRAGKIVIPIEIDEASLGLLIALGYLPAHKADQAKAIAKALEHMLRSIERHA